MTIKCLLFEYLNFNKVITTTKPQDLIDMCTERILYLINGGELYLTPFTYNYKIENTLD